MDLSASFFLLYGVYEYNTWLSVFAGLTIILGAVYMLRMFKKVMLGPSGIRVPEFHDLYWNEKLALGLLVVVIIAMGVYPKPVLDMAEPVLQTILNKTLSNDLMTSEGTFDPESIQNVYTLIYTCCLGLLCLVAEILNLRKLLVPVILAGLAAIFFVNYSTGIKPFRSSSGEWICPT